MAGAAAGCGSGGNDTVVPAAWAMVSGVVDEEAGTVEVDGTTVAEVEAPGGVPEVEVVEPAAGSSYDGGDVTVRWTDDDVDAEGRTYGVFVSRDGTGWRSVIGETTERRGTLPADLLESGAPAEVQIMVTVSDGVNASYEVVQPFA